MIKTISKKDPSFQSYLLGTFSKTERALPLQSLNVSTDSETVTFQIVPRNEIKKTSFSVKWVQILKLRNFILIAAPIFLVLVKNILYGNKINEGIAGISALGVLFLLTAMNLRNDFRDHLTGLDRIHPESGSRAIQSGWIAAYQVKMLSNIFILLGVLFGLPAVISAPELLVTVGVMALVGVLGAGAYHTGLKYRLWTELVAFFLLGPILTLGYQRAIGMPIDVESISIGIVTGWFAVFVIHLRNFQTIMVNNQAGFVNTINLLGFEKSKKLLSLWWIVFVILLDSHHIIFSSTFWMWVIFGLSLIFSIVLLQTLQEIKSPVASGFQRQLGKCRKLAFIVLGIWLLENFAYLLVLKLEL